MTIPRGIAGSHSYLADGPSSVMESGYLPALIETARITNVNVQDWTVDAVSLYGNKFFEDIQVMAPYFHYQNGEGAYVMPEVGAMVWVCVPSSGNRARPFILGFQAPYDEETDSFRSGRQSLNPGDYMVRTRDDNFVILRRGGVVQIGATAIAQRIYVPIRNYIRDFCENYELNAFGGELTWLADRTDQTKDGTVPTKFSLLAKERANNPAHVASITIGSHGEGDQTTLKLVVNGSGEAGAESKVTLVVAKDGNVSWRVESSWAVSAESNILLESDNGNVSIEAKAGEASFKSAQDMGITSGTNIKVEAGTDVTVKAPSQMLEASTIRLGGPNATDPAARAPAITEAIIKLAAAVDSLAPPAGPVTPQLASILPNIPSTKTTVE